MESHQNTMTPKQLVDWSKQNKDLDIKISETPIKGYTLCDIKVSSKTFEDGLFLNNDEVFNNIRRGNAIASMSIDKTQIFKYARKGIIKFFDYMLDYSNNKQQGVRVLGPVKQAFEVGRKVKIYVTEKANGENVQIAFEELKGAWVIGSKNVSIIVRDRNDIGWYRHQNKKCNERYNYAISFAELWFDILETRIINKGLYDDFINDITGYTLCGENIGDLEHQHIKLYEQKDIMFFGMVNNQTSEICEPIPKVNEILSKYGLTVVSSFNVSPEIGSFEEFSKLMEEYYIQVLHASVEKSGEGCVCYISEIVEDGEKVISLAKLKTFEYRFLRKIREKTKTNKKRKSLNINNILRNVEEECIDILKEEGVKMDLKEYLNFAKFIIRVILSVSDIENNIADVYAEFIKEVKRLYEKTGHDFNKLKTDDFSGILKIFGGGKVKELHPMDVDSESEHDKIEKDTNNLDNSFVAMHEEVFDLQKNKFKTFEKGKTYLLMVLGLVASGKSTIISYLEEAIKAKALDINFAVVSSDALQGQAIADYISKNPGATHEIAFSKINKNSKQRFDDEVNRQIIKFARIKDKVNLIFLDKNFPIESVEAYKQLTKENLKLVVLYPKIYNPYDSDRLSFPFSFNYFVQCYYRLKGRKNHETLDFDKNPHAHYILLSFSTLYKKVLFELDGVDMYPLTITDESENFDLDESFVKKFNDLIWNIGKVKFNIPAMLEQFEKHISEVFNYIEEKFPEEIFVDKRDFLKKEIYELLENKLKNE
jgi:hypothetical protein